MGAIITALWTAACTGSAGAADPSLQLEGVHNFRDIGGYETRDGRTIRHGILYRSADLGDMTPADRDKLLGLGIRYEIDLRGPGEIAARPSKWGTHPMKTMTPFQDVKTHPNESYDELNADIVVHQAANIGSVLHQLGQGNTPTLLHCAAGNDRTGITVAVLMKVLEVPAEQIDREYLRSNEYWTSKVGRQDLRRRTHESEKEVNAWSGLEGKALDNMFHLLDQRYGSFDAFLRDQVKLTQQDVEQLRNRFLQK